MLYDPIGRVSALKSLDEAIRIRKCLLGNNLSYDDEDTPF